MTTKGRRRSRTARRAQGALGRRVWFDDVLKLVMAGSIRKKSSRVVGKFSRKVKLATDFTSSAHGVERAKRI